MRWLDGIIDSVDKGKKTLGDGEGQESLAYCSPWGPRARHTQWLNNDTGGEGEKSLR